MKQISNLRAVFFDRKVYEDWRTEDYYQGSAFSDWRDDETDRIQAELAQLPKDSLMPTNPGCEPTEDDLKASQLSEELRLRRNFLKLALGVPSNQVEADQCVTQWEASKDYWQ